ncbi:hypothetical protein PPERSA_00268 [Pseudocohnilembus persalinus]|uniref:Uncharacterized protein n=1 Tax=Pseudocohnilembus persalinus TaxID=266149 RepID=A0A0V0Q8V1_PSEPJ|nr:hypothetical protein PPERSA_00268 [Pseudocohnilembus persalinus]|eukprot:KRW98680.1 hypothetical protein PPERSA_00268 [Pseudocohnilembus persalinus]
MQQIEDNQGLKNPLQGMDIIPMKKVENKEFEGNQDLNQEIQSIQKYFKENLKEFDIDVVRKESQLNFKFPLPETVFKEIEDQKDAPAISFREQNFEVERLQVRDLSQEQLNSIKNDGTFEVQSQRFNVPYKWKVSEMIILGRSVLKSVFFYHLAHVNGNFWKIFSRVYSGTDYKCDIYKGVKATLYKPLKNIFSLVFGKKQMRSSLNFSTYLMEQRNEMQKEKYRFRSELRPLQEFYLEKEPINDDEIRTKQKHKNYFNSIQSAVQEENAKYQQKYLAQLSKNTQIQMFREKLEKEKDIPQDVKQDFMNIARALFIVQENEEVYKNAMYFCPLEVDDFSNLRRGPKFGDCLKRQQFKDYNYQRFKRAFPVDSMRKYKYAFDKRNRIEEEIKEKYPVLGKHPGYKIKLLKEYFKKEDEFEQGLKTQKIMNQLNEEGLLTQLDMYKQFQEYKNNWPEYKKRFLKVYLDQPYYEFNIYKYLAYPNEVITTRSGNTDYHYIKTTETYTVKSYSNFWKLKLFAKQFFVYSYNICTALFKSGNIQMKKIFLVSPFPTRQKIVDGRIVQDKDNLCNTVISTFIKNYNHALAQRAAYELIPDDQFLRKRYGRIFNIIKIYFFKLFIADFLVLFITLPIILLVSSVICYTGSALSPVLALGFQLLNKAFTLLIYDHRNYNNLNYLAYFPLVSVIGQSLIGVVQIGFSVFMIGFDVIRIGLHLVLAFLRYGLLTVYNTITFYSIIKPLARVPVSESPICFRVAGPGVGKQDFFYTIQEDDVALLVRAEMEKIQLKNYQAYVNKQIEQVKTNNLKIVKSTCLQPHEFLKQTDVQFKDLNFQIQILQQRLSAQINSRNLNFPRAVNMQKIRFKAEELEQNLKITEDIVAVFLDPNTPQDILKKVSQNVLKRIFQNPDIIKPLRLDQWQFDLVQDINNEKQYNSIKKRVKKNLKSNLGSGSGYNYYDEFGGSSNYLKEFRIDGGDYAGVEEEDEEEDSAQQQQFVQENYQQLKQVKKIVHPNQVLQELNNSNNCYSDRILFFANYGEFNREIRREIEEQKERDRQR